MLEIIEFIYILVMIGCALVAFVVLTADRFAFSEYIFLFLFSHLNWRRQYEITRCADTFRYVTDGRDKYYFTNGRIMIYYFNDTDEMIAYELDNGNFYCGGIYSTMLKRRFGPVWRANYKKS